MLSFVDQSTNIKVFRVNHDSNGQVVRERLGVVRKKDFTLDDHLSALPDADRSSVDEVIEFYNKGRKLETLSALYALPVTLRKVVDYVTVEGTKFERDMLMMSLVEALRVIRKAERDTE